MALVSYRPIHSLQQEIDRLFEGMFGEQSQTVERGWYPTVDVAENEDAFLIK